MALLLSISIFLLVVVISMLIGTFFFGERETVEKRLARYVQEGEKISVYNAEMEEPFFSRLCKPVLEKLTHWLGTLTPKDYKEGVEVKLFQAGYPMSLTVEKFILFQFLLITIFPLILTVLFSGAGIERALFLGLIGLIIGLLVPEYFLRKKIRERALEIQENLPDLLDVLTVSIEAGLGFDAALSRVIEKTSGALTVEFRRLLQEIRMGKPRLEAFREMGQRSISPDLTTFCSALTQADQLGVGIGQVLRVQSDQMRQQRRQRAEEAAMKAPIKMLFPLVMLIFPALFIILLGPALIRLIEIFGGM